MDRQRVSLQDQSDMQAAACRQIFFSDPTLVVLFSGLASLLAVSCYFQTLPELFLPRLRELYPVSCSASFRILSAGQPFSRRLLGLAQGGHAPKHLMMTCQRRPTDFSGI